MTRLTIAALALALLTAPLAAAEGFITTTFGNAETCQHKDTMKLDGASLKFDLSALPPGTKVLRATLIPKLKGGQPSGTKVVAADAPETKPLATRPPMHQSLDATTVVAGWATKPETNKGFAIPSMGNADFKSTVLEVSYFGKLDKPAPVVAALKAEHKSGQTFLTWKEPEDVVGKDDPTFEEFEKAVLEARAKRLITYRVYRDVNPITPASLGKAQLVREIPEAVSCWYILAVKNTEHPQPGKTKTSPLRGGNLVLADIVTRYHVADEAPPLPRATGLAVIAANEPGKRHYAVTVAVNGAEAVAAVKEGEDATAAVDEKPSKFPAIILQRKGEPARDPQTGAAVHGYVCWMEHPYVQFPRAVEIYMPMWKDLPPGSAGTRLPLYVNLATYGTSATEIGSLGWHNARRYVGGALTLALAEEGSLWTGQHESLGTLRGYDGGVVWDYDQRRVLGAAAWALEKPDLFLDPERVYVWGQSAHFALRYPDVFAVALCDGHATYKNSKEGKKHAWRWGPPGGGKNWLGENHLDYLDLPKFLRENPAAELPFAVIAPAYGAFPDHTLGDFGFKPWQEFLGAMKETKRAFTACWMVNGPGPTTGVMRDMVPLIRLHQSLPAFSNCSLDTSPDTDNPKGEYRPGKYDHDFQKRADKDENAGINIHQRWDQSALVDEPDRWAVTVWLAGPGKDGKGGAPGDCTTDLTPRRCQKFKAKPGEKFGWTATSPDGKEVQKGQVEADRNGLVTVPGIKLTTQKVKVEIKKQG